MEKTVQKNNTLTQHDHSFHSSYENLADENEQWDDEEIDKRVCWTCSVKKD